MYKTNSYYSIKQVKVSMGPKVTVQQVDKIKNGAKCEDCGDKFTPDSKHSSEKQHKCSGCINRLARASNKPERPSESIISVIPYPSSENSKTKAYISNEGFVYVTSGAELCIIGSDLEKEGILKKLSNDQIDSILSSVRIDQTWRTRNHDPISWSDY